MTGPRITTRPAPFITGARALDARARALKFAIQCFEAKRKAAPTSRRNDMERSENTHAKTEYTG